MKQKRIAILGAGIMGMSTALMLARRGMAVEIFDLESQPFAGASRWNEGKIHLGYIYAADPALLTAKKVIPGGLRFKPIVEELLGCSLASVTTTRDDIFLCHQHSVVSPDTMQAYFKQVANLVRQHPDASRYLVDVSACDVAKLDSNQLSAITDSPEIVAGFRIPERSISTVWLANRFSDALQAEKNILAHMNTRVTAARPTAAGCPDQSWSVDTSNGSHGPYDHVINALWHGRLAIDHSAGIAPSGIWSNRYRQSLFLRTKKEIHAPSAIVVTGPFGDIKNYNNRDFYLSWYPEGLRVDSDAIEPPAPAALDDQAMRKKCDAILGRLETLLPAVKDIRANIESLSLEGGWVFAAGQGALSDPASTLHRRKDFGICQQGNYLSIDTGKFSTAPWLAKKLVEEFIQ